ncbi:hypothetical protein V8B55DRAFT_1385726 [Mucor lusitanicus]
MTISTTTRSHSNQIERRVSMATTATTIASRSNMTTKKSITSTVVSSDSTPLSIAERFMSENYHKPQDTTIITKVADTFSLTTTETPLTTDTPINQTMGRCSVLSVPCSPAPPVFSSSFDAEPQGSNTYYTVSAPHPLDNTAHGNTRRKTKCNSGCNEMRSHNNNKKSKTNLHRKQHHHQHHKHSKSNKIDVIKPVLDVPEKSTQEGVWVSSCCFIQWSAAASTSKQDPILPIKHRHAKDADRRCCCWGRRAWVILAFLMVIMVSVLVFVFWPRIPLIRIEGAINTIPTKVTQTQQGGRTSNVAFESTWLLNITMDNRRNFFTTRFNRIQIIAKDAMTGLLIGKGLNNNVEAGIVVYLPGKEISTIQLPISVNYQARDSTDATFSNLMRACHANTTSTGHHSLSIHFWFTLYLFGLDWLGYRPTLIATPATGGFFCPSVLF